MLDTLVRVALATQVLAAVYTLVQEAVRTAALVVEHTLVLLEVFIPAQVAERIQVLAAASTQVPAEVSIRARAGGHTRDLAVALTLDPVADATLGRVATAATLGTAPIPIADNAQDIVSRTAAIVPLFSFLAFSEQYLCQDTSCHPSIACARISL